MSLKRQVNLAFFLLGSSAGLLPFSLFKRRGLEMLARLDDRRRVTFTGIVGRIKSRRKLEDFWDDVAGRCVGWRGMENNYSESEVKICSIAARWENTHWHTCQHIPS